MGQVGNLGAFLRFSHRKEGDIESTSNGEKEVEGEQGREGKKGKIEGNVKGKAKGKGKGKEKGDNAPEKVFNHVTRIASNFDGLVIDVHQYRDANTERFLHLERESSAKLP